MSGQKEEKSKTTKMIDAILVLSLIALAIQLIVRFR